MKSLMTLIPNPYIGAPIGLIVGDLGSCPNCCVLAFKYPMSPSESVL